MANLEDNSIWPDVEERIVDLIEAHHSSIVFTNSRRLAERLTARLNEIHAERAGVELGSHNPGVAGGAPAHLMGSGQTYGAEPVLARAHHGSVSKEQRAEIEQFRTEQVETRKQLRAVRHSLAEKIEGVGSMVKATNVFGVPALILVIGLFSIASRGRKKS